MTALLWCTSSTRKKTEASLPPFSLKLVVPGLPEPSRRMGQQGVDQAGLRGQVAAQRRGATLIAGDFVEQPLELGDVAVDRLLEATVGAIFAGDFIEGLLPGRRVQPLA